MAEIEFSVKCPSRPELGDFKLRIAATATVGDVKQRLQESYPGNPEPASITAIYAGRVLKDNNAVLSSFVVPTVEPSCPQSLHIVIKSKPAPPAPSAPQPLQQQRASDNGAGSSSAAEPPPASAASAAQPETSASAAPAEHSAQDAQPAEDDDAADSGFVAGPGAPMGYAYLGLGTGLPAGGYPGVPLSAAPAGLASSFQLPTGVPSTAPLPSFAYSAVPNPAAAYAMYTPALSAAYSAALQVLQQQAAGASTAAADGQEAGASGGAAASAASPPAGSSAPAASSAAAAASTSTTGAAAAGAGHAGAAPISLPMPQPLFQQPAIAFVPTLIPVPQPVLPAYLTANQGAPAAASGQQQEGGQPGAAGAQPGAPAQGVAPGRVVMAPVMPYPLYQAHPMQPQQVQIQYVPNVQLRQRRRQPGQLPGAIADMLRQQQQHGPLPPALADLLRRHDQAAAAAPAAAGNQHAVGGRVPAARAPGQAGQLPAALRALPQLLLRLNMRALLQLVVLMVVVQQHCPPGRFLMLLGLGLLLYLTATEPVRQFLNRLAGLQHRVAPQQRRQAPAPAPGAPAAPAVDAAGPQQQGQQGQGAGEAAAAAQQAGAGDGNNAGAAGQHAAAAQPAGARQDGQHGGLLRELQALVLGFFTSLIPGWNVNPDDAAAIAAAQQMFAEEEDAARQAGLM